MSDIESTLAALLEAVRLAPENIPLTKHYVQTLLSLSRAEQAESFVREQLNARPGNQDLQVILANVFYRQNKNSHAMAIVETMVEPDSVYPPALVLHAKLQYREGNVQRAVSDYKLAVEYDSELADSDFASLLGIQTEGDWGDEEGNEFDPNSEVVDGRIRQAGGEDFADDGSLTNIEKPQIKFDDVGGMEAVKEQIRVKVIYPITHAEMFAAYGKKTGGGILLYGPPGCGKTFIARATAGEVNANFISVGINDVLDMWIGNSERNLHELFEQARRSRPCVLFFDEVDALGASRSDMRQSAGRHLVNQFLSEMDGMESDNDGLLILGATNTPWHVDSAFRRPGRFDRVLFVPPPDEAARQEVLKLCLKDKPVDNVDYKKVAAKTADYSGADMTAIVELAIESKLQQAIKTGKPSPITTKDLLAALKQIRPTTKEWFATARNHALYANQGGAYDDILEYLKLK